MSKECISLCYSELRSGGPTVKQVQDSPVWSELTPDEETGELDVAT